MITRKNHTHTHTLTLHEPAQPPPRLPRDHPPQLASLQSQSPGRALLSHPPQRKGSIKCRVRVRVCGVSQRLYPFSKTPQNIINLKKITIGSSISPYSKEDDDAFSSRSFK